MLFDSWAGVGRMLLVGTLAYVALVLLLRISGKRTLTKLNTFDLVVRWRVVAQTDTAAGTGPLDTLRRLDDART